jgi:hypothetical protein
MNIRILLTTDTTGIETIITRLTEICLGRISDSKVFTTITTGRYFILLIEWLTSFKALLTYTIPILLEHTSSFKTLKGVMRYRVIFVMVSVTTLTQEKVRLYTGVTYLLSIDNSSITYLRSTMTTDLKVFHTLGTIMYPTTYMSYSINHSRFLTPTTDLHSCKTLFTIRADLNLGVLFLIKDYPEVRISNILMTINTQAFSCIRHN